MKPIACLLMGLLLTAAAQAQKAPLREPDANKPRQFMTLPLIVPVVLQQLDSLLQKPEGSPVSLQLQDLRLTGRVVSRGDGVDRGLETVVIRLEGGNTFALARRAGSNGFEWSGRILSYERADALELVSDKSGLRFEKRALYDLLSE
ncbi:hypothetical protein [Flaviaesturariibacter aridisoli]|uniref:DUF4369 domain-containing protein n=1 Tax=Flaviaesturariibacter aridisoli TaxID=2545761 RepID=A0A4R4E664_9BACT|nr:hypothetical protein [Flaviaesturariibacter aridisoli]TCZ74989.1 hypothetical protein E0486_01400 [Flaviaesturariibacter aridisoli]